MSSGFQFFEWSLVYSSCVVLSIINFDPTHLYVFYTDASAISIDAVLSQVIDGEEKMVLFNEFISHLGAPHQIHCGQGRNFENQLFAERCKLSESSKTHTTPYRPQSDGPVERFNRTLKEMSKTLVNEAHGDWGNLFPYVTMAPIKQHPPQWHEWPCWERCLRTSVSAAAHHSCRRSAMSWGKPCNSIHNILGHIQAFLHITLWL